MTEIPDQVAYRSDSIVIIFGRVQKDGILDEITFREYIERHL